MASFQSLIDAVCAVPSQAWNGGTDVTSAVVDTAGAEAIAFVLNTGTVAAGADLGIKIHEGATSTFTAAEANEVPDARIQAAPEVDATDNKAYVFRFKPNARYVRFVISRADTDAAAISAVVIKDALADNPA